MDREIIFKLIFLSLLAAILIQGLLAASMLSIAGDEPVWIPVGYSQWHTGNFGMNPTHPPLTTQIAAIPLLAADITLPTNETSWENLDILAYSIDFLYTYNDNLDQIVFWSRVPFVLLSVLLGIFVFQWARELYGRKAGLFALFLYAFHPLILGNSMLVMTDFGVTVFAFISLYFFYRFQKDPQRRFLFISAVAMGLAFASKATGLFLIPLYAVFLFIECFEKKKFSRSTFKKNVVRFVAMLIVALVLFAGVYAFEFRTIGSTIFSEHRVDEVDNLANKIPVVGDLALHVVKNVPVPFAWFMKGLYIESIPDVTQGKGPVYLFGELSDNGYPEYFLVGLFLKTPIPLMIFLVISIFFFQRLRGPMRHELLLILPILLWLTFFSFSKLGFGLRYIIPILPLLVVFVSKIINLKRDKLITGILIILAAWYAVSAVSAFPTYLSYFNEFVEPGTGHEYYIGFAGAGENLLIFKQYAEERNLSSFYFAQYGYWIPLEMERLGLEYEEFCGPREGTVVIGVKLLANIRGDDDCYNWLHAHEPETIIGNALFVYTIESI